ncbi:uncharacterized protein LOC122258070 [Penaeus japonicus]|uniref:uncharacterized protein LOC122258070 n=1 Tax=Penaeus japonicus TaxID=27405 RepID=UPI001C713B06|nr:uncharacterized protein LOC122258070 [Penaeus japonicus]
MNAESEWWWAWSGAAGGAWAAVVCVVMVMGGAVNVAVLIHWATSRPAAQDSSPSAALPCVDLLLCVLAAPLRYAHAPPIPTPAGSRLVAEAALAPQNASGNVNATDSGAAWGEGAPPAVPPGPGTSLAHAVVVSVCLSSLHVVALVALHRLTLLLRCCSSCGRRKPFPLASPLLVLTAALAAAAALVGGLHATGRFTDVFPLLGVSRPRPPGAPPPPLVVGFLSYVAGLCGATTLCYVVILAALVHQGRSSHAVAATPLPEFPGPPSYSSVSSPGPPPDPEVAAPGSGGHGLALRACMTVLSVLVTLSVCWAVPVCLALYALLSEAPLTPSLPYSDALLLLSGLVHPFVYGEGWAAVAACVGGLRYGLVATCYRAGLVSRPRTRMQVRDQPSDSDGDGGGGRTWRRKVACCWPCRSHGRHLSTHAATDEEEATCNSFPLRLTPRHHTGP